MSLVDNTENESGKTRGRPFPGSSTQFDGCSNTWPEQQLVIGLDFGTAYTKAVVGESRIHYAVPMFGLGKNASYIAPSGFYINKAGIAYLSETTGDCKYFTNLKMSLLMENADLEDHARITTYLALCIRRIRYWLLTKHKAVYGRHKIDWALNVGIPTDSFWNDSLNRIYNRLAYFAWAVSIMPGSININYAKTLLESGDDWSKILKSFCVSQDDLLDHEMINSYPEFLAQVVGYVRSPRKQIDLHMLIDIGAGTMDCTAFNILQKDGEDIFPIFSRSVTKHGTYFLIQHRLKTANRVNEFSALDFDPVPAAKKFAECLGIKHSDLDTFDKPFHSQVYAAIGDQLRETKVKMYKKSPKWKEGVPVFLTGGGANVDFYQDVVRKFKLKDALKISVQTLPKPDNLQAGKLDDTDFGRLSVAYGLSFDPDDLGSTYPSDPDDSEGSSKVNKRWEDRYIDKSMV